jgi:hypothetical protein
MKSNGLKCGLWALLFACFSSGCSLYSLTGDVLASYSVEHLLPHLMTGDDPQIACETGVSLSALLLSFGRVTDRPHRAGVASFISAATCPEARAQEAELAQLRALKSGATHEAQDARILEKKAHWLAASRYHKAYLHLVAAFGEPGSGACPDFDSQNDELLWLLGLTGVIQAVEHDRASGGRLGISMDLPRKAARGMKCLNNEAWWGVPNAVEAAVWIAVPGAAPEGAKPWLALAAAAALGDKAGVRMARAIEAKAASIIGKTAQIKKSITAFAEARAARKAPGDWRLLDELAAVQVQALSDRIWTEVEGHRTPIGQLGTFGEDESEDDADDLLGDI